CEDAGWMGTVGMIHSHPTGERCWYYFPGTQVASSDAQSFARQPYAVDAIMCGDRVVWISRDMVQQQVPLVEQRQTEPPRSRRGNRVHAGSAATSGDGGDGGDDWPSDVEPEQQDVTVAHHIVPPFAPHQPLLPRHLVGSRAHEVVVRHRLGADEPALEVGVDLARRVERRTARVHRPRANFILANREEGL